MQSTRLGEHSLAVPGRHEADALADCCLQCTTLTKPAAVADEIRRGRITCRIAAYRCASCDSAWLCWWGPSQGRQAA